MREEHNAPIMETLGKVYDGVEGDLRTALYPGRTGICGGKYRGDR